MASSMNAMKKNQERVKVMSVERVVFELEPRTASQSLTIKRWMEDRSFMDEGVEDPELWLPNVTKNILEIILVYCKKHANDRLAKKEDLKDWDLQYITQFSTNMLYHLLIAADYLEILDLLDLIVTRVADLMKGKMPEQIRQTFGIKNDFPPGMEEEIRKENPWAFEIPEIDKPNHLAIEEELKNLKIQEEEKKEASISKASAE